MSSSNHPSVSDLRFGSLHLRGRSVAGVETWLRVHPPGLAFDAGRGPLTLAGARDLFLSHGHLDHALGVPYVLSQRTLHRSEPTRVFCPAEIAEDLGAFVEAAARLEGVTYDWELAPLEPGDRVEVGRDLAVEAFATDHVVPSLGFHLLRADRRLKDAYRDLEGAEIGRRRRAGEAVEEITEELALSYCGDTGPAAFDLEPRLFATGILVVECTFLGAEHRHRGRRFKHLHLEDLAARRERFANRAIVLHHVSRRHRLAELRREVERLLGDLAERVHILGEEETAKEPDEDTGERTGEKSDAAGADRVERDRPVAAETP